MAWWNSAKAGITAWVGNKVKNYIKPDAPDEQTRALQEQKRQIYEELGMEYNPIGERFADEMGEVAEWGTEQGIGLAEDYAVGKGAGFFGGVLGKFRRLIGSKSGISPRTPIGHKGKRLNVPDGTNKPGVVGKRDYSGHTFDRMQSQGITPSVVENAVQSGTKVPGKVPGTTVYHDTVNNLTVVTDSSSGRVVTVDLGIIKQ